MTLESVKHGERYFAPEGWSFDYFKTSNHYSKHHKKNNEIKEYNIRFGRQINSEAQINVIIIPGLMEPADKYFEVIGLMDVQIRANYWIMEPFGQGGSSRYLPDEPRKMHSVDLGRDSKDINQFVDEIVSRHPASTSAKLKNVVVGVSRGGHLSSRSVGEYPGESISGLFLVAPMIDIKLRGFDKNIIKEKQAKEALRRKKRKSSLFNRIIKRFAHSYLKSSNRVRRLIRWAKPIKAIRLTNYIPGHNVPKSTFYFNPNNPASSYEPRMRDFHAYQYNPVNNCKPMCDLTWGGLYAIVKSVKWMKDNNLYEKINIPTYICQAGDDKVVSRSAQKAAVEKIPDCQFKKLPGKRHDLLLEDDTTVNTIISTLKVFIEQNNLLVQNRVNAKQPAKGTNHVGNNICTP